MKTRLIILIGFLFLSCNNSKESEDVMGFSYIINKNKSKLFVFNTADRIFQDKGVDSIKGGQYVFYGNARLKSYTFFQNRSAYTFREEYDSLGKIVKTIGSPLVDTQIAETKGDSVIVKYFFYSLNRKFVNAYAILNYTKPIANGTPLIDTLYSNIASFEFGVKTKNLPTFTITLKADYVNMSKRIDEVILDTINLRTFPRLEFDTTPHVGNIF